MKINNECGSILLLQWLLVTLFVGASFFLFFYRADGTLAERLRSPIAATACSSAGDPLDMMKHTNDGVGGGEEPKKIVSTKNCFQLFELRNVDIDGECESGNINCSRGGPFVD